MDNQTGVTGPTRFKLGAFDGSGVRWLTALVWLVGGYIALVPTLSFIPSLGAYNEKRALQIGVLVVIGSVLLVSTSTRRRWLSTFTTLPLAARLALGTVLGFGLLSAALAPATFYGFLEVGHFVLLFVAAGAVASVVREHPKWTQRGFLGVVAVSGLLYAVYFAVGYGMQHAIADIKLWPEGGTNYVNIRSFNQFQTWTLPLFAGVLLVLPRRWRVGKGTMFGVIVLWWALVFASNVRGTIVAVIIGAVGVGLLFRSHAKKWVILQAVGLLLGLVLYYVLFSTGEPPPVTDKFGQGSPLRLRHWAVCLELMWADPLLGAGPMHFAWPPYQFTEPASPHSALFQWLAEWGLPSTLIMGGLTIWGGWSWMQQERHTATTDVEAPDALSVALVASLLAAAAHSMVSGLIVTPISQMFLVFVGGWAWGRYRPARSLTDSTPSFRAHIVLCVLLVGSTTVLTSSLQDLSIIEERRSAFIRSVDDNRFSPRYWGQGYIGVRDSSVIERARREW